MKGSSEVGSSTYELAVVATISVSTGVAGLPGRFAMLDGKDGYVLTTQMGGFGQTGSIMAWVSLAELPKRSGHISYVAGQSQNDLQFEADNRLRFFTASGNNVIFAPDPSTLVNHWHMIAATMDATVPLMALYWDGQPVAQNKGGNRPSAKSHFFIGDSPDARGRSFHGGIDEVAVAAIFKACTTKP